MKKIGMIALVCGVTSFLVLLTAVLLQTHSIPRVQSQSGVEFDAGARLLVRLIKNPGFAVSLLAPIFMPIFASSVISSSAIEVINRRRGSSASGK